MMEHDKVCWTICLTSFVAFVKIYELYGVPTLSCSIVDDINIILFGYVFTKVFNSNMNF